MKTFMVTMAFASVLALGGVSHASQMASPIIFGSGQQVSGECTVFNGGTAALAVTLRIVDDFAQTVATRNCGMVGVGQYCSLFTPVSNEEAHGCVAVSPSSIQSVRGSMVLYDRVGPDLFDLFHLQVIRAAPLR